MSTRVDVYEGSSNPGIVLAAYDNTSLIADFSSWYQTHWVTTVPITLVKSPADPNKYNVFHANICKKNSEEIFEVHVAVVDFNENLNYTYINPNVGAEFSLEGNVKEIPVKVLIYDINQRPEDQFLVKCGQRTSFPTPTFGFTALEFNALERGIPPQPEVKNGNILVGKK